MEMNHEPLSRRGFIGCVATAATLAGVARAAETGKVTAMDWIKPKGLKQGDTVSLVAPAGPADGKLVLSYKKHLEQKGFRVQLDPRMLDRKKDYLAGDDSQRSEELNLAIRDPLVRAVFPIRGGYGLTRILDRIDYASLRKDPKVVTGYSDLTALHLAIARQSRIISFHSPMPMPLGNLGRDDSLQDSYGLRSFERMLIVDRFPKPMLNEALEIPKESVIKPIHAGKAQGRLVGGNLSLVCATMGTPYALDAERAILFLEDVNEAPYRVDRLFSQLRLAGVLDAVAGIVLGQFTTKDPKEESEIELVIREVMEQIRVPVVANFPVGHVPGNATLPHGAMVQLDADLGALTLLEEPCIR